MRAEETTQIQLDELNRLEKYWDGMNYDTLPNHMRGATRRYIEHGIDPGSFLTAIIENNLCEAVVRADDINRQLLDVWVKWFYNEAPSQSWGSPEDRAAYQRKIRTLRGSGGQQ